MEGMSLKRASTINQKNLVSGLLSSSARYLLPSSPSPHPGMFCSQLFPELVWPRPPPTPVQWIGRPPSWKPWPRPSKTRPGASCGRTPYGVPKHIDLQQKHLQIYLTGDSKTQQNRQAETMQDTGAQQTEYGYHCRIGILWRNRS